MEEQATVLEQPKTSNARLSDGQGKVFTGQKASNKKPMEQQPAEH